MKKIDETITLFDLKLFSGKKSGLLNLLESHLSNSSKLSYIFTPNPEQVVISLNNTPFKRALQRAEILIPDGIGLVWASRKLNLVGKSGIIQERIAGREVVQDLIEYSARNNYKILVIGGRGYAGKRLNVQIAVDSFIEVRIVAVGQGLGMEVNPQQRTHPIWWLEGFANSHTPTAKEEVAIEAALARYHPDIVCVALGAPAQEVWLDEHRTLLEQYGVRLGMAVGGSFDVILGVVPGVPNFMSKIGLEWLFRLIFQPWRWRRQLRLLKFEWLVWQVLFSSKSQKVSF